MKLNIAVLAGDGIGPEVTLQAIKAEPVTTGIFHPEGGHKLIGDS